MALYNMGRAKSVLDQANQNILGDDTPSYANAYQAITGDTGGMAGTPDWFQKQRATFYAPTDIDTKAIDLMTSTSAQAEDWRSQGEKQYQDFTKQYGANTPWLFRGLSEGGFGLDPTKYNLLQDPTRNYSFEGDVASNPYLNANFGIGDAESAYLYGTFNPITGEKGASWDMFYKAKQGPAPDKGRGFFGSLLSGATPMGQAFNTAKSGIFGSGVARTAEGLERSMPGYEQQQRVYDKLYGYVPQAAKPAMNTLGGMQQSSQRGMSNAVGYGADLNNQYNPQQRGQQEANIQLRRGQNYATRFENPYRRYNPYEY